MSRRQGVDGEWLANVGFEGFERVAALRETRLATVPREPGVYAVVRSNERRPSFLAEGTGGWFKGGDPNVPIPVLEQKWVTGATVVYIGKAGSATGSATLRSRLRQLVDFGAGKAVGHRGGRYLWQLSDSDDLEVCWRLSSEPRAEEGRLLTDFERRHGALPFANLVR